MASIYCYIKPSFVHMRPSSSHLTLAALFLACITTLSLIIHTQSARTCSAAQRKRLLSFALQHTQGNIKSEVCEASVLSLGAFVHTFCAVCV